MNVPVLFSSDGEEGVGAGMEGVAKVCATGVGEEAGGGGAAPPLLGVGVEGTAPEGDEGVTAGALGVVADDVVAGAVDGSSGADGGAAIPPGSLVHIALRFR
jgi:hypothetical protein